MTSSDTKTKTRTKLTLNTALTRTAITSSEVKQTFARGRTKKVQVERKHRTPLHNREPTPLQEADTKTSSLSESERKKRLDVLQKSQVRAHAIQADARIADSADPSSESGEQKKTEPPTPDGSLAPPLETKPASEPSDKSTLAKPIEAKSDDLPAPAAPVSHEAPAEREEKRDERTARKREDPRAKKTLRLKGSPRRRESKLTIAQALDETDEEFEERRGRSIAAIRRAREKERQKSKAHLQAGEKVVREVVIPENIVVSDLANRMAARVADLIKTLMRLNVMTTAAQSIDADTAELAVLEFGHKPRRVSESDIEDSLQAGEDSEDSRVMRPAVVTVMGHVDHGKTSLLDALRKTDIASRESGGITQHIGASMVSAKNGQRVCFIDTPGHQLFSAMRARGARVTDIVILVVAANDGVRPQTVEAINHARAANVPIVVAINKCDLPEADIQKIEAGLLEHNLAIEKMGGETLCAEISALAGKNLDKLLEAVFLQAELLDLRANPDRLAEGTVLEARLETGRGAVASLLVQRGTLRKGDIVVAGTEWGRIRAMTDDKNQNLDAAPPGSPVEVLGLNGVPRAGEAFSVTRSETDARNISGYRTRKLRESAQLNKASRNSVEQLLVQLHQENAKELNVIIKADAQGSVEAITNGIEKIANEDIHLRTLHGAAGGITESDVTLANACKALIIGFNVRATQKARTQAQRENIDIRYYSVIYEIFEDIEKMLKGMQEPEMQEDRLGYAEIRALFDISKVGKIAGCQVTEGKIRRNALIRIIRDDVVIHEGVLKRLRRFKEDVREVDNGMECGVAFENFQNFKTGDRIECFVRMKNPRKADSTVSDKQ